MTAIGRLGFGMKAAFSSRYQSVTAISLIALMALVLAALPKENTRGAVRARVLGLAVLVIAAVFLITNNKTTKMYTKRLERKPIAEVALRLNIASDQHLRAATSAMEQLYTTLPALRAAHHVPFNTHSRCEEMLGRHLAPASNIPVGSIDNLRVYTVSHETRPAIELAGLAARAGHTAECVAIVDGNGIVIGAGISTDLRSDAYSRAPFGWKAVASYPQSTPVCAFALFPNGDVWFPLANCQARIADANPQGVIDH
jgi:hypothetical protein